MESIKDFKIQVILAHCNCVKREEPKSLLLCTRVKIMQRDNESALTTHKQHSPMARHVNLLMSREWQLSAGFEPFSSDVKQN